MKQRKIDLFVSNPLGKKEQKEKDQLIVDFIVADALPLQTVEHLPFHKLVYGMSNQRVQVMGVKKLRRLVEHDFSAFQEHLRLIFTSPAYVCLTTDAWSSRHRSYIGFTAHWINPDTFKRESAAIGLKRFVGRQFTL